MLILGEPLVGERGGGVERLEDEHDGEVEAVADEEVEGDEDGDLEGEAEQVAQKGAARVAVPFELEEHLHDQNRGRLR